MIESRAIELLEYIREIGNGESSYNGCAQGIALDMAIQSIKKQIPTQPLRVPTDDSCLYYELRCPNCDAYMSGLVEMHHCKCGQALDWT